MRCALHFCLLALLVASVVVPQVSDAGLAINEFLPAPGSDWDGDADADSKKDEWAEVVNSGPSPVDLGGYLLLNSTDRRPVYGFTGSLGPGEFVTVYGSEAVAWESANGHSSIGLSLNNTGDMLWLVSVSTGDTVVVDSVSYASGSVGYDVSVGRSPDGVGPWVLYDHFLPKGGTDGDPTPGASNSSDPPPHIFRIARDPLYPTSADAATMTIEAGDASGISQVLYAYQINLEDGEEPAMDLISGAADLGTWAYTTLPCAAGDTVRYRFSVVGPASSTITPWMGYRVRSGSLQVRLNEILADPPADLAGDANRDGVRDAADDEFVEIVNCGATEVDLSGWSLTDATSVRHVFSDSASVMASGELVTVFGGGAPTGFIGKVFTASGGGLGLANSGDVVYLLDDTGAIVDVHSYGGEGGHDEAMIRYPDCADTWLLCSEAGLEAAFTPQEPNDAESAISGTTWGNIKSLFK
jgi:hypothetical protein